LSPHYYQGAFNADSNGHHGGPLPAQGERNNNTYSRKDVSVQGDRSLEEEGSFAAYPRHEMIKGRNNEEKKKGAN